MPLPLDPTQRAALRNSRIAPALFLDLFVDGTSLHCWNQWSAFDYDVGDGVERTYEPLADRLERDASPITMGDGQSPESLVIMLDASTIGDDDSFMGRFADSAWHRRRFRMTLVLFAVGSGFSTAIAPIKTWEGNMDFRDFPELENSAPKCVLRTESGTYRYAGRNVQTRTDENQQRFFPGDVFFQDLPSLIGKQIPWHDQWVKTPTGAGGIVATIRNKVLGGKA